MNICNDLTEWKSPEMALEQNAENNINDERVPLF